MQEPGIETGVLFVEAGKHVSEGAAIQDFLDLRQRSLLAAGAGEARRYVMRRHVPGVLVPSQGEVLACLLERGGIDAL